MVLLCALVGLAGCAASRGATQYRAGTRALAQGDSAAAIGHLEAANELLPGRSEILNHLGIAYDAAGRSDAALSAFEQAVAADCDNAAAESNLALSQQRAAQRADALEMTAPGASDPPAGSGR